MNFSISMDGTGVGELKVFVTVALNATHATELFYSHGEKGSR